ncbi:hypothetical protein K435DRAFT_753843 [Dendrothele bispora CBS 962.96]|uniref:Uncharacterized protein n=1 Tax=Dendrothele bispora (strain CBS 962.96) TaxID=1314807 RepID=A0A4S8M5X0_DENBC|nr:hypothetical protein K435DRAFT_753843 [Dendrothele bispora CBS 962.96]
MANSTVAVMLVPHASTGTTMSSIELPPLSNASKGRKRTIDVISGGNIDLRKGFIVNSAVAEAMRQRILELEEQVDGFEKQRQQPSAKRARLSGAEEDAPVASGSGNSAATEKKRKLQLKKIFDRLSKECKSDTCKFQGSRKNIKIDEVLEESEFEAIFKGKGTLIQPTPENKPKSTVTIIQYGNAVQISELFGDQLKEIKGYRWTRGGIPSRGLGGGFGGFGSSFSKSVKIGACAVDIRSLQVEYSKKVMKCVLKFEVVEADNGMDSDDDYFF